MAGNIFDQYDPPVAPVDREAAQAAVKAFPAPAKFTDAQLLAAPGPSRLPPPPEPGTLTSSGSIPPLPAGATLDPPAVAKLPQQQGGHFTDAQLLSAPGPDPRQLPAGYTLDRPQSAGIPPLPPGATLDKLPPPPEPGTLTSAGRQPPDSLPPLPPGATLDPPASAKLPPGYVLDQPGQAAQPANPFDAFGPYTPPAAQQPGLATRLLGIGERGMIGGVDGIVNTAQAAGRWADRHLPAIPGVDAVDSRIDNFPVAKNLDQALAADHPYMPQEALGKILQGAISGVTGAALTGGAALIPSTFGAAVGAAVPTAKALGASDETANDIGIGLSLLPVAGATAQAARGVAGSAARSYAAGRAAANMTDDQAIHTVLMNDAIRQIQDSATGSTPTSFQAAGAYKKDLANVATQYARSGQRAGVIDRPTAQDLTTATSQANAHTNALSDAPGSAFDAISAPGALPDAHVPAVQALLKQLDATSPQQFKSASAGPFASAASAAAPYASWGSALGSLVAGHAGPLMDVAAGGVAGRLAGAVLPAVGRAADHLLGTAVTPAEANYAGALRRVQQNGLAVPSAPLTDTRGLIADNTQLASDNAAAAAAQSEADRQYLYQHADAQAMNRQFDMTANQQRAYEVADASAMDRQITQGQNNGDSGGNWLERQLVSKFKRTNPGTPVLGARAISANDPQSLFEASAGRYGSPADDQLQTALMQDAQGQVGPAPSPGAARAATPSGSPPGVATAASQGRPVGVPQGQAQGASERLQQSPEATAAGPTLITPQVGPFDPTAAPSGGVALAGMMHRDMTGLVPTTAQLHQSANAVLDPQTAFEFASGINTSRDTAYKVALHAAQSVPDQASADVSSAMGATSPAAVPGDRGPVRNPIRYQAAVGCYGAHAQLLFHLAPTPAAKTAISQIAATPAAADKQAILDVFKANNPGADTSMFTPQLMKGI